MVLVMDLQDEERMSLEEYEACILENVNLYDFDSVAESAWALRRLANDRSFLIDCYHDELAKMLDGAVRFTLSPQSIYVIRRREFFVRANIWLPMNKSPLQRDRDQRLFSYSLPHDHNFDFVTVGYFGPGYHTDLYVYDRDRITGYVGEDTDLHKVATEQLSPGRIMVYEAGVDVHTQHEPEEVSLSINLLPLNIKHLNTPQYVFDEKSKKLSGGVTDQVASRLFLLDFFRSMSNETSIAYIFDVMSKYDCPRTRGYALNVLEEIAPHDTDYFRSHCDPMVYEFARCDMVSASYNRD